MVYGNDFLLGLWAVVALFLGAAIAGKLRPGKGAVTRWLKTGRGAPMLLLFLGCAAHGLLWGTLQGVAIVHDEASYLLQAQTFAQGMWSLPSPPLPAFFEQFHVLVEPVLASKYPPGHGLLLALGVLIGWSGLVPLLLNGLTGMLLFLLVRRVSSPWPALTAWFLWLIAPAGLAFRPSYFSEVTTGFLMLFAWWQLLDWRESSKTKSLLLLAGAVGWSAITRPLTALAFALPIGVVVLYLCVRRKLWKQLAGALVLGMGVLTLLPIQSLQVTGDWALTPYSHYSEVYFPFDAPGFDKSNTQSLRELPQDMREFRSLYLPIHYAHSLEALPGILVERVRQILHTSWGSWWILLAPLSLVALLRGTRETYFALCSALLLIVSYLVFAHPPAWVLYYMEAQQVIVALAALGLWQGLPIVIWFTRRGESVPEAERSSRVGLATALVLLAMLPFSIEHFEIAKRRVRTRGVAQTEFRGRLADLPQKSVVFVRYKEGHDIHASLITNVPNLEGARAWAVYDRGALNKSLMRKAEGRVAYIYEEQTSQFHPMDPETGDIRR